MHSSSVLKKEKDMIKKTLWLFLLTCSFGFSCFAVSDPIDIKNNVLDKLDIPVYPSMQSPEAYGISLNYTLQDTCVDCVISFFKTELKKKGWKVDDEKLDRSFQEAFSKVRGQLEGMQGSYPQGFDTKTAEAILSGKNDSYIKEQIKKMSPTVIEARREEDGIICRIFIHGTSGTQGMKITLTLSAQ